jgi:hypothetical protein
MGTDIKCIFCDSSIDEFHESSMLDVFELYCPNCGKYKITNEAQHDLPKLLKTKYSNEKYKISGVLLEMQELKFPMETITRENFERIYYSLPTPNTLSEKLDKILMYIFRRTNYFGQEVICEQDRYSIGYAKDSNEFQNMLNYLYDKKFIKYNESYYSLTYEGWERVETLSRKIINSKRCFVAMWFSKEMDKIYSEFIYKAIKETGYKPIIIKDKQYNNDINDEIISEIRKSKFVVADFTGNRGGVYYEAGFAYGLGLNVIYTCSEEWFNKTKDVQKKVTIDGIEKDGILKEERFIHFDINHNNFICWKNGEDLYNKLKKRIEATIV